MAALVELDRFLDLLASEGYGVGVRERAIAHALIGKLIAQGSLGDNPGEWQTILRPLLSRSVDEQRGFAAAISRFRTMEPPGLSSSPNKRANQEKKSDSRRPPARWSSYGWVVAIVGAAIVGLCIWLIPPGKPPDRISTSESKQIAAPPKIESAAAVPRPIYVPNGSFEIPQTSPSGPLIAEEWRWFRWISGIVATLSALLLAWWAWKRSRQSVYLQNVRTDEEIEEHMLRDRDKTSVTPAPAKLLPVTRLLRQRVAGLRGQLDVKQTIRATSQNAGVITALFRALQQTPEYLVLIDELSSSDHQARYHSAFVAALQKYGVSADVYYFAESPANGCWRSVESKQNHAQTRMSFSTLANRHSGHRLLMFGDASALLDSITGKFHEWTRELRAFPLKAWFSPIPIASWSDAELSADRLGFLVLPAQAEALDTLAEWFASTRAFLKVDQDWPGEYPAMLRHEALVWAAREAAPPAGEVAQLIAQLRTYLGEPRFRWLSACAVFPVLSWPLTVALGRLLTHDGPTFVRGIAALGALPWFRYGRIPEWLRLELISRIAPDDEKKIHELVQAKLNSALVDSQGETIARISIKKRLSAWFRRNRGLARDALMVGFLEKGMLPGLAQRLPERLKRAFFHNGQMLKGVRPWLPVTSVAFALLGTFGATDFAARFFAVETGQPPLITVLKGHQGRVWYATFSPDGKQIVTASADKIARLWGSDGTLIAELKGHQDVVWQAAFSLDGKQIVTASADMTARLWASDGTPIAVLKGHQGNVVQAAFSPDGKQIVTASYDETARLWASDGTPITVLKGHQDVVWQAAFSPDGKQIVTASGDKTARLWTSDGTPITVLNGHQGHVAQATFSPDGKQIVTASEDKTARLWASDGTLTAELKGHQDVVLQAAFSLDGKQIVTASEDKTARLWASDGTLTAELKGHQDVVWQAAFSLDGKQIVTASADKTARLWASDGTPIAVLKGHQDTVIQVAFSTDGKQIVTASGDKTARLWGEVGGLPVNIAACSEDPTQSWRAVELADSLSLIRRDGKNVYAPAVYGLQAWATVGLVSENSPVLSVSGITETQSIKDVTAWVSRITGGQAEAVVSSPNVRKFININFCRSPSPDANRQRPEPPALAARTGLEPQPSSEKLFADLRFDVFWCESSPAKAREQARSMLPILAALGVPANQARIRKWSIAQNAPLGFRADGFEIRYDRASESERRAAETIAANPRAAAIGKWRAVPIALNTSGYLSLFVCPSLPSQTTGNDATKNSTSTSVPTIKPNASPLTLPRINESANKNDLSANGKSTSSGAGTLSSNRIDVGTVPIAPSERPAVSAPNEARNVTQKPARTVLLETKEYQSAQMPSGIGRAFSPEYELCNETVSERVKIVEHKFRLVGDRSCGAFAECRVKSSSPERICYGFKLQGHDEWIPPKPAFSQGILTVTYERAAP
jgi:WD40 repeat protein